MRQWSIVVILLAVAAVGPAAMADRLVLRDGGSIETKGAWSTKGKLVVFQLPNGTLSSLRAEQVDLDQSVEATRLAAEPAIATPPPSVAERRAPVLVLTDDDITSRAPSSDLPRPDPEVPGASASESGNTVAEPVVARLEEPAAPVVVDWRQDWRDDGGLVIAGTLRNDTRNIAIELQLTVALFDAEGAKLDGTLAELGTELLKPGEQTLFRAVFPQPTTFSDVSFDVAQVPLVSPTPPGVP